MRRQKGEERFHHERDGMLRARNILRSRGRQGEGEEFTLSRTISAAQSAQVGFGPAMSFVPLLRSALFVMHL